MRELKIRRVWNTKSESFSPDDINDAKKLAEMRATQPLWDEDFNEVVIHTNAGSARAHFKLKTARPSPIGTPDDADPKHDDAVESLLNGLTENKAASELLAKIWVANKPDWMQLWAPHPSSSYTWYAEPSTRITLGPSACVQPDIVGVDVTRLNRTVINPSIIIEVVHHHWPEEATWFNLVKLSTMNYIVAFYFVQKDIDINSFASKASLRDQMFKVSVNCYLRDGNFYRDGNAITIQGTDTVIYNYIKEDAMRSAKKAFEEQRKRSNRS